MGAESSIINGFNFCGFMFEKARHFQALLVYIEHRYYGLSMPFGSREESFRNASTLGYFTSTQAMADYATLILDLKKNLSAENSPVIVFGASYGGMLAAWFRLKYPHVTIGALAASAPILYFDDITPQDGYDRVVTQDFRNASESCYNTIKESWAEINKVASQPGGLESLKHTFNTCRAFDASSLMDWLATVYDSSARYAKASMAFPKAQTSSPAYPLDQPFTTTTTLKGHPPPPIILVSIFNNILMRDGIGRGLQEEIWSYTEAPLDHNRVRWP